MEGQQLHLFALLAVLGAVLLPDRRTLSEPASEGQVLVWSHGGGKLGLEPRSVLLRSRLSCSRLCTELCVLVLHQTGHHLLVGAGRVGDWGGQRGWQALLEETRVSQQVHPTATGLASRAPVTRWHQWGPKGILTCSCFTDTWQGWAWGTRGSVLRGGSCLRPSVCTEWGMEG